MEEEQLKEEWNNKRNKLENTFGYIPEDESFDWWLQKFSSYKSSLEPIMKASYESMLDQKMTMYKGELVEKIRKAEIDVSDESYCLSGLQKETIINLIN